MGRIEEGNMLGKIERKSKKQKKRQGSAPEELNDCSDAMHARVEDGAKVKKEGKNKKKKSKKDVVCNDAGFNTIQNEAVHVKDYVEVIDSNRKENDQMTRRKSEIIRDDKGCEKGLKKHRRIGGEATVVKEFSDVKFHDGGEKKRSLKLNEENDAGDNCMSKASKDKRRSYRENSDKYAIDSISFLMEMPKCN